MKHKALIPFLICFLPYFELAHGESAKNREKFLESTGMYLAAIDMMERMQNSRCAYLFEEKKYSLNSTLDEVMPLLDLSEKRDLFGVISSGKLEENKTILDSFFESASKNSLDEKTSCGLVVGAFAGVYKQNINNWKDLLAEQVVTQNKVPPLSLIAEPSLNTLGFKWFEGDEIAVTGKGKYVWASGDVYEGDWVNSERTGKGKITLADGGVYEGDYVNGERTGKGKYVWADGDVYEGDWVNGERTGQGKHVRADGDVYEGDFVNGEPTGQGKYVWADGDVYEGDWVNDERTGQGKYVWADGDVYEGDFVNGERTGQGKYVWADGDVYEGDFVNGERTGQGKHTSTSGEVHEGVWSEGNIVVTEKNRQKNCKPLTDLLTRFDARTRKMFDPKAIKQDRWSTMLGGIANTRPMGSPMGSGASAARNFDAKLERAITARESRRIEIVMKISDAGC